MLTDESIFPYGKYRKEGATMEEVPAWFLLDQYDYFKKLQKSGKMTILKDMPIDQVLTYVDENRDVLEKQRNEER